MPTIPTGDMEKELRKLYLRWLMGLSPDTDNLAGKISTFQAQSEALITKMGGRVAALGALGDFPAPKLLELSPYAGKIYDGMQQAAIQAGVAAGMNSVDVARAMFRNGMDKSFNQLKRLARTETTNAYWKNAFDSVADLPALVMVWGSEDGPKTCAWCRERDGLVMDSPSLRDHPNGRCTPIPTLRSRVQYRGSIDANGRIYVDDSWGKAKPGKATPVDMPFAPEDIESGMRAADRDRTRLYSDRYIKKGRKELHNEAAGWDYDTQKAWNSYTSGGYTDMNTLYRDPEGWLAQYASDSDAAFWIDKFRDEAALMEKYIKKNVLDADVVVARGVTSTPTWNPGSLKAGDTFADPGFLSTSSKVDQAQEFADGLIGASKGGTDGWMFYIKAPKGTNAVAGVAGQGELIFGPGQMQRVVSIDPVKRIIHVEMF